MIKLLQEGTLLKSGDYRIERVLGQGGFGITYLATQVGLDRQVAIKEFFMKEYCERDSDTSQVSMGSSGSKELVSKFKTKFIKEAKTIAGLNHPNIIRIYDIYEENGTAYYVMEYHGNGSLSELLNSKGKLSEIESLRYIRQIADALSYIHENKMNHLDVKPGNVLLDNKGNAVLIDFGLSKRYDEEGNQTSTTPVGISHGYTPMEQYKKGGVGVFSPSTDIYSLGATLYKLLTGETPPEADEVNEDGLPELPVTLSQSVRSAIVAAMQPKRKDQPQSIPEFLQLLDGVSLDSEETELTDLGEESSKESIGTTGSSTSLNSTSSGSKSSSSKSHDVGQSSSGSNVSGSKVSDSSHEEESSSSDASTSKGHKRKGLFLSIVSLSLIGTIIVLFLFINNRRYEYHYDGSENGYEWVDLGLSVKWATCNVGAVSPESSGSYFAWGETSPKSDYEWETYKFRTSGDSYDNVKFSKYNTYSDYGPIDANTTLDLIDDVARVNWGGSWRMPTLDELDELRTKCSWTWTISNGVKGRKVTGPNGNSIFLPAAGYRYGTAVLDVGSYGYYWSSSLRSDYPSYACCLYFFSDGVDWYSGPRYYGHTVRAVCP